MTSKRSGETRIMDIRQRTNHAGGVQDWISMNKSGGQAKRRANASQGSKNRKQKGGESETYMYYNIIDHLNIICDIFYDDKGVKRKFSNIRKTGGQIEISLPWTLRLPDVKQKMNGDSFWEVGDDNVYVHVPYWNPIYLFPRNTTLGWCDDFYIVIDGLTASDFEVGKDNVIKSVTIPSNVTIQNGQDSYNTRIKTELDFFKTNGLIVIRDKLRPRPKIPSKDKQRQTSVS